MLVEKILGSVYATFIDQEKADGVKRKGLWNVLECIRCIRQWRGFSKVGRACVRSDK